MRSVSGDDVIYRTVDTALQCGYKLIGEMTLEAKLISLNMEEINGKGDMLI